jgi:PAS domain S-box-containing protein
MDALVFRSRLEGSSSIESLAAALSDLLPAAVPARWWRFVVADTSEPLTLTLDPRAGNCIVRRPGYPGLAPFERRTLESDEAADTAPVTLDTDSALGLGLLVVPYVVVRADPARPGRREWMYTFGSEDPPGAEVEHRHLLMTLVVDRLLILENRLEAARARAQVLEGRKYLRQLVDNIGDGLLVVDLAGKMVEANPAAERALGVPVERLLGAHLAGVLTLEDGVPLPQGIDGLIDARATHRPGMAIQANVTHFRLTDGRRGRVVVLSDVTTLRAAEDAQMQATIAALEASRSKSRFLANMSHELRTPLNAIIGYGEYLQEAEEDDWQDSRTVLPRILSSARHLLALISDVLDLTKIEAGKTELHEETFSVPAHVEEVTAALEPLCRNNGNRIVLDVAADVGSWTADQRAVRQCLYNLVANAVKFTENGCITIRVRRETTLGGTRLWFEISDTGIGMSEAHMARLFEDFMQADASTTRRFGGTGLGLALTRRLCRLMGGDVTVRSVLGHGSTFSMVLPARNAAVAA